MPVINIRQSDIMKTQNLPPDWYGAKVVKIHDAVKAKSGDSVNYKVTFLIEGERANGKEVDVTFNSTLIGKLVPVFEACFPGKKFDAGSFDLDELLNKSCDVKLQQRTFEGNMFDDLVQFAPSGVGRNMKTPF